MSPRTIASEIASAFRAYQNCLASGDNEWAAKHTATIDGLVRNELPSGSGIDTKVEFDWDKSTPEKLIFRAEWHSMNDAGYYTGYHPFAVIVRPSLAFGFVVNVTGANNADTREYLAETFQYALTQLEKVNTTA